MIFPAKAKEMEKQENFHFAHQHQHNKCFQPIFQKANNKDETVLVEKITGAGIEKNVPKQ